MLLLGHGGQHLVFVSSRIGIPCYLCVDEVPLLNQFMAKVEEKDQVPEIFSIEMIHHRNQQGVLSC